MTENDFRTPVDHNPSSSPTAGSSLETSTEPMAVQQQREGEQARSGLPTLYRDPSFLGLSVTQFLGAFNDNLFKQILLLLFVAVPTATGNVDYQWLGTLAFSLPFILFSGYAGYLSDRYSKRTMIVLCKVGEIGIMGMGLGLFLLLGEGDLKPGLLLLFSLAIFLMGSQSAFFGPGKYGILPEMLRERDLPRANGFLLMTTFLAIIFGSALAGGLLEIFRERLWISGSACIVIALVGTVTALLIRPVRAGHPRLEFEWSSVAIPREMRRTLLRDRALILAVAVSSLFWMAASLVQMAVNALGKNQLQVGEWRTSIMMAMISVGIAGGSILAGSLSRNRFNTRVLKAGAWGMVGCLALLSLPAAEIDPANDRTPNLLGYFGSVLVLVVLGGFTGMFAVPLQVFLQSRPPPGQKGRMIATQNLLNWVGITMSAGVYFAAGQWNLSMDWPGFITFFGVPGTMMLVIALFYHPRSRPATPNTPNADGAADSNATDSNSTHSNATESNSAFRSDD